MRTLSSGGGGRNDSAIEDQKAYHATLSRPLYDRPRPSVVVGMPQRASACTIAPAAAPIPAPAAGPTGTGIGVHSLSFDPQSDGAHRRPPIAAPTPAPIAAPRHSDGRF